MIYIGVDVGKSAIKCCTVHESRGILNQSISLTDRTDGGIHIVDQLIAIINTAISGAPEQVLGIGIGIFGELDRTTGVITKSHILHGLTGVPLLALLSEHFQAPIRIENDVHSATIGEYLYGASPLAQSIAILSLGTSLGVGTIYNESFIIGFGGMAGQIAHLRHPYFANSHTFHEEYSDICAQLGLNSTVAGSLPIL